MEYLKILAGVIFCICLFSGCGKSPIIPQKVLEKAVQKEIGFAVEEKYPDYRNLRLESVKSVDPFKFDGEPLEAQCGYIAVVSFIAKGKLPWSVDNSDINNPKEKVMYHFANVVGTLRFVSSQGRWRCDRKNAPKITRVTIEADGYLY